MFTFLFRHTQLLKLDSLIYLKILYYTDLDEGKPSQDIMR